MQGPKQSSHKIIQQASQGHKRYTGYKGTIKKTKGIPNTKMLLLCKRLCNVKPCKVKYIMWSC